MITIIIILIMLTVMMGAATYGLISGAKALQTNIEKLIIEDRLEEAAQGVLNNITSTTISSTQTYGVPTPDNLAAPSVPSWITANAQTPRGVKFLYCPFSNISGSGSTITTPSGSYAVTITQGVQYNYVTASAARPANASTALAIIVAPGPNQAIAPDCQNITANGTLAGAQVRVITEAEVQSHAQVIASAGNEYYAAPASSGDGSGSNSSNAVSLADVITYQSQYRPQAVKINLAGGTYSLDQTNIAQTAVSARTFSTAPNNSLYFSGAGAASTVLQSASTSPFPYAVLANSFYQNVGFPASPNLLLIPQAYNLGNIVMENTVLQYANVMNNGHLYLFGMNTLSGSNSSSATGYESMHIYSDGQSYWGGTTTFPTATFMAPSSFLQLDNLGQLVIGANANVVFQGQPPNSLPIFSGSELIDQGTMTQTISSGTTLFANRGDSRSFLSGATFNNIYLPILNPANSLIALDRGTSMNVNSTSTAQLISNGGGGELDITNSTLGSFGNSSLRPNPTSLYINAGAGGWLSEFYELGGGATGGWTTGILTGTSTTACATISSVNTTYHSISDSATANGSSFLPQGTATFEPLVILNRAGWTCTHS